MKITELLIKERMNLDLQSVTKEDVINELAEMFLSTGIIDDLEGFMGEIKNREALSSTALEEGIEIHEPDSLDEYSGQFKLRIPRSLHRSLVEHSKKEGISMNQYCVYLLSRNDALYSK